MDVQPIETRHFKALSHPMRHRLLFALGEKPATTSQLAAAFATRKGNIAHHLKVLLEADLVRPAGTQRVRGGVEQYYERVAQAVHLPSEHYAEHLPTAFRAIADELAAAREEPLLVLRYLRLSPDQAARITATLNEIAHETQDAGADHPRYGVLVGLFQPAATSNA
ncbi:DNA-binding transcriptional regulator, ArsR family [Asanoa hainanensis]|uniref:DNA-binding transcriptional regulator, ArsR family n=1 Tax=Asanoa hainanensis TaxID=560556 RepID=A0A239H8Q5_9ACTN|nr:helix-turn-helix domain-containing protein [Asanoa hainanensis]SNS77551.1 DNA-binding transcriptional regulator, ArsR family [Asanoa hainanensis]